MSEVFTFLKKCGAFFVVTDNNGVPAGRPFDSLIQDGNDLIIGVSNNKDIYRQLKRNGRIQLVALDNETRHWIRVNGLALEEKNDLLKNKLVESSSFLQINPEIIDEVSTFKVEVIDYKIYR